MNPTEKLSRLISMGLTGVAGVLPPIAAVNVAKTCAEHGDKLAAVGVGIGAGALSLYFGVSTVCQMRDFMTRLDLRQQPNPNNLIER